MCLGAQKLVGVIFKYIESTFDVNFSLLQLRNHVVPNYCLPYIQVNTRRVDTVIVVIFPLYYMVTVKPIEDQFWFSLFYFIFLNCRLGMVIVRFDQLLDRPRRF